MSIITSHFQCHQLTCKFHPTTVSSDAACKEKAPSDKGAAGDHHEQLTSMGLLSVSLLWEAHTAPAAAWHKRQPGLFEACPVFPKSTPGPSGVITSQRAAGKSCSKHCKHRILRFKCFSYCKQFTNYSSNDWIMAS